MAIAAEQIGTTKKHWGGYRVTGKQGHKVTGTQGHRVTRSQGHRVTRSQGHRALLIQVVLVVLRSGKVE